MTRKLYLEEWLALLGFDKSALVLKADMSWTTLRKIITKGEFRTSTIGRIAKALSEMSGRTITVADLYKDPFRAVDHAPPSRLASFECIDLDKLTRNPLVRLDNKPLSPKAQEIYDIMLDALRRANKEDK